MNQLQRTLGLGDLTLIVVGSVIGSGIYIVPATVLQQVGGRPGLALGVWFAAGILSLLGALTYGELGCARPEAGGMYVFLRDAFGRFTGFLYGWTLFFVIGSGTVAALGAAFASYVSQLTPLSTLAARIVAVLMTAVVMLINLADVRSSVRVQNLSAGFKVLALIAMSLLLIVGGDAPAETTTIAPLTGAALLSGVGVAMIGVLWAYEGWQYVTFSAGEAIDPQRNLPLGITIGTAFLILLYCLANIGYVAALGPAAVMESPGVAAAAVGRVVGEGAGRLVAVGILISIFGAAHAVVLTASRVFFAMARDGVFFRRLAEVNPRTGAPAFSIIASCVWAMILAASGTFNQLLTYVVFTGWIFYALAAASIFVFRRREPLPSFRVPGYPLTPLLFIASAAAIVFNALFTTPREAFFGILMVLIGAPAYLAWRRAERGT